MDAEAEREAQLAARVREHLQPGETLRAAVWVSRPDGPASAGPTRAEMSPFRFRRPVPAGPGARPGVHGAPRSRAVDLDGHIRIVTDPRILARTDRRLLVLAKRLGSWRDLFRPASGALPPLRLCWECPRADLASATGPGGRLRLTFTDGSAVTLLTPAAGLPPFLAA
ncbi:hypothetical protein GCM10020358_50570 [Amorphoplanes nipponensis]|uniref:Uncharacterized protein n=1 Tax=Actinoplanes nipponensis TaxID=135950 RepID=A0A919MK77_9ACTN|nr:hypothetical protein [Actinoplanes nipponensis]GIE47437.1 hypothetical protein Ani05nite_09710 [Actinoplanes nipponensis]